MKKDIQKGCFFFFMRLSAACVPEIIDKVIKRICFSLNSRTPTASVQPQMALEGHKALVAETLKGGGIISDRCKQVSGSGSRDLRGSLAISL